MKRDQLTDLAAFVIVAEEHSFTRAAAKLGLSQSALSHAMKQLEARLGIRLLSRTTRSVSTTDAGRRLYYKVRSALDDIATELDALNELRDKPSGTVRITTAKYAAVALVLPMLERFTPQYPDVRVELIVDEGLNDIVADRYDAGIRLGEQLDKDMVAVRIGPDLRFAVVGSPEYFAKHPAPESPRDLSAHNCINYRQTTSGGLYAWDFEKDERALSVRVNGSLVFNDTDLLLAATLTGLGLSYLFEGQADEHIASGKLLRVLDEWCPSYPGFYLYYPSQRQTSPAFTAVVEALRYRE